MSYLYVICVISHEMSYYEECRIWHLNMTLKYVLEIFSLYKFRNPLYFQPNLKSLFTYQNGLGSKKLLRQNSRCKFSFSQESQRPLLNSPKCKTKTIEVKKFPAYSSHKTNYVGHTFAFSFTLFILRAGLSNLPPGKN